MLPVPPPAWPAPFFAQGVQIFSPATTGKPVLLPRGCRLPNSSPNHLLSVSTFPMCSSLPCHLTDLVFASWACTCRFENGDWIFLAGSSCLSPLDEVWHNSLVVAVESHENGSRELPRIHLAKLLPKVVSAWSWSVNVLAFHPQRQNLFPNIWWVSFPFLALQVDDVCFRWGSRSFLITLHCFSFERILVNYKIRGRERIELLLQDDRHNKFICRETLGFSKRLRLLSKHSCQLLDISY